MNTQSLATRILRTHFAKRVWRKLFGAQSWAKRAGTFREKEAHGLIQRSNYAYGMLRAADTAKFFGKSAVTACEFGVATGMGLINMTQLAELIEAETGVKFRVVGFDTGAGLPAPSGYKDHPELWSSGDFSMGDPDLLRRRLAGAPVRKRAYDCVSCLNRRHMTWAWCSLFSVGFSAQYVRMCSMGFWTDWRII